MTRADRTREILCASDAFCEATKNLDVVKIASVPPIDMDEWSDGTHDEVRAWAQTGILPVPEVIRRYIRSVEGVAQA